MTSQSPNILGEKIEKIRLRCELQQQQIERDENLISEVIDYLSDNKQINVDELEFCKDFAPALSFDLPVLALPSATICSSCPLQLKTKAMFQIDNEIVMCFKLSNISSKSLCNITCLIYMEDNESQLVSNSRSVLCTFVNKNKTNNEKTAWHKFCPIQTDIVDCEQCVRVYLVAACPSPAAPVSFTVVVDCAIREGAITEDTLVSFIEPNKWKHWRGVLTKLAYDPWELNIPLCLTQTSITSPDTFMMSVCSVTAFSARARLNFHRKSELQTVLGTPQFQFEKVSGQSSVLYSKVSCLSSLLVFVLSQDIDVSCLILCGKENVIETFINKLISLNIKFEISSPSICEKDVIEKDVLLREEIKIMEEFERRIKPTADTKIVAIDGFSARNLAASLASLELKRLCLNDTSL